MENLTPEQYLSMYDLDAIHPGFQQVFDYQKRFKQTRIHRLEYQLAVFSVPNCKIYKLRDVDLHGRRFFVFGERMTTYISFGTGFLFSYTDTKLFDKLYYIYSNFPGRLRPITKEALLKDLRRDPSPTEHDKDDSLGKTAPNELDEGQFENFFKSGLSDTELNDYMERMKKNNEIYLEKMRQQKKLNP